MELPDKYSFDKFSTIVDVRTDGDAERDGRGIIFSIIIDSLLSFAFMVATARLFRVGESKPTSCVRIGVDLRRIGEVMLSIESNEFDAGIDDTGNGTSSGPFSSVKDFVSCEGSKRLLGRES